MTKHTPGPWVAHISKVDEYTGNEVMLIRSESPIRGIAAFEIIDEEEEGNAHLIAASPELLSALKDVFKMFDEKLIVRDISRDHDPMWAGLMMGLVTRLKFASDAIAKAEGRDP